MGTGSKIFLPCRSLGYVSNQVPLQVRYIKNRKENLIVTCVGKSFHTYGISHFGLLSVSGLHPEDITCMTSDSYHVYTCSGNLIYAWRRGVELKHTYRGHQKPVHLMIPFGVHLISVDEDNQVKIWDIKDESVYLELNFSKTEFLITALLHPSTYINKILFASNRGQLQLWNLNKSKLIYSFNHWDAPVTCLQQAPAIDVVAIGFTTGKIVLHNLKFDETVMEFTQDWGPVTGITFRLDGKPIMATGSNMGHIVFWDLEQKKVANQLLKAHDGAVTGLVCLPNEPLVLTSSPDNSLKLWIFDMSDESARLLRIREGHSSPPSHIRFHGANGHNILSAADDSTLRIFNTQTEQFNKSLGKASYNRKITKKKNRLVEDPLIMPPIIEFDTATTREKYWDNIAAIHSNLPIVTTWSYDKVKMGDFKLSPNHLSDKNDQVEVTTATCLSLTSCGNFVLIGYSSGHLERFNIQSGLFRESYGDPKAHETSVRGVTTDFLNQIVVSGGSDSLVKFWKFNSKDRNYIHKKDIGAPIKFFRSHRESSMLAIILEDFTIYILDMMTYKVVRKFVGHSGQITDSAFSPDSRWLITAAMDCTIRTWDIPSGQLVDQFAFDHACVSLSFSLTGESLATAHVGYKGLYLWTNKSLYCKIGLKPLDPQDEAPMVLLPECKQEFKDVNTDDMEELEDEFKSPEQINKELITFSGISTSRWQNLLNIDIVKQKNKPKEIRKAPNAAPFFLPTVTALNFQFDLGNSSDKENSKLISTQSLTNFTQFGKLLNQSIDDNKFTPVIDNLKNLGPSMIDFEIKSLSPIGGGTIQLMLQFLKCLEYMLKSNKDFELAEAYLSVFLKSHGKLIASESALRNYLSNVYSCHNVAWNRLSDKLLYSVCVVQNLKTM